MRKPALRELSAGCKVQTPKYKGNGNKNKYIYLAEKERNLL